jgi:hypothetical protein
VRGNGRTISLCILDNHDQSDGALVTSAKIFAFLEVATVLSLEVEEETLDLGVDDLSRPEESDISRLAVVACGDFKLRTPRRMGKCAHDPREHQLPCVAQCGRAASIPTDHDVDPDRSPDCAERIDLHAWVSLLHATLCIRGNAGAPTRPGAAQAVLGTRKRDLSADGLALLPGS